MTVLSNLDAVEKWPLRHFSSRELVCRCCGSLYLDRSSADRLDVLREDFGSPLLIASGYRCPRHNKAVGGAPYSYHMRGRAFDIATAAMTPDRRWKLAQIALEHGWALGVYDTFIHVDTGPARLFHG